MTFNYEESYEIRKAMEPARSYLWRVVMPDIRKPGSRIGSSPSMQWAAANALPSFNINMLELNARVLEINTPYFAIETRKNIEGASFWYSAQHNDISTISLTLEEGDDGSTFRYINAWKNMIVNSNSTYNPPAFFKKDIYVYRLNLMKQDFQLFRYNDYFPSELADISNTYEDSDTLQYHLNLTGDSLTVQTFNENEFTDFAGTSYEALQQRLLDVSLDAPSVLENIVDDALIGVGLNVVRQII